MGTEPNTTYNTDNNHHRRKSRPRRTWAGTEGPRRLPPERRGARHAAGSAVCRRIVLGVEPPQQLCARRVHDHWGSRERRDSMEKPVTFCTGRSCCRRASQGKSRRAPPHRLSRPQFRAPECAREKRKQKNLIKKKRAP